MALNDTSSSTLGNVVCGPITLQTPNVYWIPFIGVLVAGVMYFAGLNLAVTVIGGIGSIILAVVADNIIYRHTHWQTLVFYEHGAMFQRGRTTQSIRYDQLQGIRLARKNVQLGGAFNGIKFEIALWDNTSFHRPPTVHANGIIATKECGLESYSSSFGSVLELICAVFVERHQGGEYLSGDGFVLERDTIQIGNKKLSTETLDRIAIFEENICLWRTGDTVPTFRLNPSKINALPVLHILQKQLRGKNVSPEVPGFGKLLFEKKMNGMKAAMWAILGTAVIMIIGGGVFMSGIECKSWTLFCILITVGFAMIGYALIGYTSAFQCHEKGVRKCGLTGWRELRYTDIASFSYTAVNKYYHGVYSGTTFSMKFSPKPETCQRPIKFSTTQRKLCEADLNTLRDHIANIITAKLLTKIEGGERVKWGQHASLTRDGVSFCPQKFIFRGKEQFLSYNHISGTIIKNGVAGLFEEGKKKPVFTMPVGSPNFFPCLHAFTILYQQKKTL